MHIYLSVAALLFACILHAQVPGSIVDPAVPAINPMNPNGDNFITSTGAAFTGPSDESQFELPFISVPQYQPEPGADNQYAAGCEFYELVNHLSSGADAGYYYYQDPDGVPDNGDELMIFRFRVARFSNGVTAFSFLIDTDFRFGFEGPEADPNAVNGNPGFEKEVAIFNNTGATGGVRVFDADGTASPVVADFSASLSSHYQVSYALNKDPACPQTPVFVDMFIPFSALGIPSSRQIRMAVAANEDIASSLGGGASDIGGVDGNALPDDDDQFIAAITHFSPTAVNNPANKAPNPVDAVVNVDENALNGATIHAVAASDANADLLTYSIETGDADGAFSIDAASGEISVNDGTLLDFETTPAFVLLVRVSDGLLYDYAIITVQLNDINEPPSVADANVIAEEHLAVGSVVHTIVASDPDANATLSYSIVDGNELNIFGINGESGQVVVNNSEDLDFEADDSHSLVIEVSDGSFTVQAQLNITIKDINEAPFVRNNAATIDENISPGTEVLTVEAGDPDADSELTYSLVAGDPESGFSIDAATGVVRVSNSSVLDFETSPSFSLTVRVSDGSLFIDGIMTIDLRDVNEPPIIADATLEVRSRFSDNDAVYTVIASDPDAGDVLEFSLASITGDVSFLIDPVEGIIRIEDVKELTIKPSRSELIVVATDRAGLAAQANISIDISRIADRDDILPWKGFSPNHDNENDFWVIEGIEAFPNNTIQIYNRWGMRIYEISDYDNLGRVWRGEGLNTDITNETTCYFIIKAADFEPITGYVIVKP